MLKSSEFDHIEGTRSDFSRLAVEAPHSLGGRIVGEEETRISLFILPDAVRHRRQFFGDGARQFALGEDHPAEEIDGYLVTLKALRGDFSERRQRWHGRLPKYHLSS